MLKEIFPNEFFNNNTGNMFKINKNSLNKD